MAILDGKKTSEALKQEIAGEARRLKAAGKKVPHLAVVLVGDNDANITYVSNKVKACEQVGFASTLIKLPVDITREALLKEIDKLNANVDIDGHIVQLPLSKHIDEQKILLTVDSKKNVDRFHPANFGRVALDTEAFMPTALFGTMKLLKRYEVPTRSKRVMVVGRSHIVSRFISILLSQRGTQGNTTVVLTHSHIPNLAGLTRQADMIVMALGVPEFPKDGMVKGGVIVVDVGVTRLQDGSAPKGYRIVGDVALGKVKNRANYITPVPGGVGPMTIAVLLKNTLLACKWRKSR